MSLGLGVPRPQPGGGPVFNTPGQLPGRGPQSYTGGGPPPPSTYVDTAENDAALERSRAGLERYAGEVGRNEDQANIYSMQRQRDALSGLMSEVGTQAGRQGMFGSGASGNILQRLAVTGQRNLSDLNAQNTIGARRHQLAALQAEAGAAGTMVGARQQDSRQNALNANMVQNWQTAANAQQMAAQAQQFNQMQAMYANPYNSTAGGLGGYSSGAAGVGPSPTNFGIGGLGYA